MSPARAPYTPLSPRVNVCKSIGERTMTIGAREMGEELL